MLKDLRTRGGPVFWTDTNTAGGEAVGGSAFRDPKSGKGPTAQAITEPNPATGNSAFAGSEISYFASCSGRPANRFYRVPRPRIWFCVRPRTGTNECYPGCSGWSGCVERQRLGVSLLSCYSVSDRQACGWALPFARLIIGLVFALSSR